MKEFGKGTPRQPHVQKGSEGSMTVKSVGFMASNKGQCGGIRVWDMNPGSDSSSHVAKPQVSPRL